MKRLFLIALALLLCFSMTSTAFAVEQDEGYFVSDTLTENHDIFPRNTEGDASVQSTEMTANSISIAILDNMDGAHVEGVYEESTYSINLSGGATAVVSNGLVGYIGVYQGELPVPSTDDVTVIIANVIFTREEMFAAITIGVPTEANVPLVLFYGDFSDTLSLISTLYTHEVFQNEYEGLKTHEIYHFENDNEAEVKTIIDIDRSIQFQGSTAIQEIKDGVTYTFGQISVFHPNDMCLSDTISAFIKVNTNSNEVIRYIRNEMGFNISGINYALYACPDTFYAKIASTNPDLYLANNSLVPMNSQEEITLSIPFVIPEVVGGVIKYALNFFSFDFVASSVQASTSKSMNAALMDHVAEWTARRTGGWNSSTYDGDETTRTGMRFDVEFKYSGNQTNIKRNIHSAVQIRYLYVVQTTNGPITLSFITDTLIKPTDVTIYPNT